MKTLPKVLLIVGIAVLIVGLGLYFLKTETVEGIEVKEVPINVDKATYYTSRSSGFLEPTTNYYWQIQVTPTATAKPDVSYLILLNNGVIKQEYKVSWSQLELAIHKPKTIANKISQDEYTALSMHTAYTTQTFEARLKHQIWYLIRGIVILVMFILSYKLFPKRRERQRYSMSPTPPPEPSLFPSFEPNPPPHLGQSTGTIYVDVDGKPAPPPNANESSGFYEYVDDSDIASSQPSDTDFLTNLRINRLVEEGKITIKEAEATRQQTKNMGFIEREGFLSAIERRPTN